jgi:hypothetical protein
MVVLGQLIKVWNSFRIVRRIYAGLVKNSNDQRNTQSISKLCSLRREKLVIHPAALGD